MPPTLWWGDTNGQFEDDEEDQRIFIEEEKGGSKRRGGKGGKKDFLELHLNHEILCHLCLNYVSFHFTSKNCKPNIRIFFSLFTQIAL